MGNSPLRRLLRPQLADPELVIKLVVYEGGNSGIGELNFDQVTALGGAGDPQYVPGDVIYDFDVNTNACYPDDWTFFGYAGTDFGLDRDVEDGYGAFHAADWTECDMFGHPQCDWVGSAVGIGPFNHAHCVPGGVSDANLDLSLGTGISIRMKVNLEVGFGGTAGARLQLQMVDDDGTNAVLSRTVVDKPEVDRTVPVPEDWTTVNFFFAGLDAYFDNDSSVAGAIPGLDISNIKEIKLLWFRETAEDVNVFEFDEITLINDEPVLWADSDADSDVDLYDFTAFQTCFGMAPDTAGCEKLDANRDGAIDLGDLHMFTDCIQDRRSPVGIIRGVIRVFGRRDRVCNSRDKLSQANLSLGGVNDEEAAEFMCCGGCDIGCITSWLRNGLI